MSLIQLVLSGLCLNLTCPGDIDPELVALSTRKLLLHQMGIELKNQHLTIATLENDMLSGTQISNHQLVGTGVAFDLLNILKRKFEFNYTVIQPKNNVWGSEKDGVLDLLKDKKADLAAAFLPILHEYRDKVSYSPSLDTGEWVVLMRRPAESATGSGLLAPFTLPVWLLILLSLFVVGPVIWFIIYIQAKLCKDDHNKVFPLPACIWFVYGALLKQGSTLSPITDSSRLLFSTWWIFITILTAFYTANLTAFLTLSKFTLPINKPSDIGEKKSPWVTTKGNALEDSLVMPINDTNAFDLGKTLGHPTSYLNINDKSILNQYVERKNIMFIREKPIVEYVMYDDYKVKTKNGTSEEKRCTYVITTFPVATFPRAFAYAKNFKYKPLFDATIQSLIESGIIKFKLREDLPDTDICPLDLGSKERQLRNSDLLMTYEIVAGGFIISAIVFLVELVLQRFKPEPLVRTPQQDVLFTDRKPQRKMDYPGDFPFASKFITPPPPYHTLFTPPTSDANIRKKNINGRDYWVFGAKGEQRMVPLRTPSAFLYQFTN